MKTWGESNGGNKECNGSITRSKQGGAPAWEGRLSRYTCPLPVSENTLTVPMLLAASSVWAPGRQHTAEMKDLLCCAAGARQVAG